MTIMKDRILNTLRWSEKYTKVDMVYLSKGGFWLLFGHGILLMSSLVNIIAFANLLPKEIYGTYQFIMSIAAIVGGFTLSGMSTAITRSVARGNSGVLLYGFKKQILWSTGITMASGIVAIYYFLNGNNVVALSMLVVGLFSPLLESFGLYKAYLKGKQLFKEYALIGLWHRPIPVIAMVCVLLLTTNPILLILTYYLSNTLVVWVIYKTITNRYPEEPVEDKDLLNYSKHLSVMSIIGRIANNIDTILVFHFLGAAMVSIYTIALMPANKLIEVFNLSRDLIFPRFSRKNFSELKKVVGGKALKFLAVSVSVVIIYIIISPFVFKTIFPEYMDALIPSQILILILLSKPLLLYNQVFESQKMKGVQHFLQTSRHIFKILSLIILLPIYGIWGAIYAILITQVYSIISTLMIFYWKKEPENII